MRKQEGSARFLIRHLSSPVGLLQLVFDASGLCALRFLADHPGMREDESLPSDDMPLFVEETVERLCRYLAGQRVSFADVPVSFSSGSAFERSVWAELRKIPYGQTITYGELAARVGKPQGARAVGRALAANPVPIVVPCHRVVRKDGQLGGFSAGLEKKRALLALEGVV